MLRRRRGGKRQPTVEGTMVAVQTLINAETWERSKEIVEKYKDTLLTDAADRFFASQIALCGDYPFTQKGLKEHRDLLRRCRENGIDAAFRAKMLTSGNSKQSDDEALERIVTAFVNTSDWNEARRVLEVNRALLDPVVDSYLNYLIRMARSENRSERLIQQLVDRRDMLRKCREVGIDEAFSQL